MIDYKQKARQIFLFVFKQFEVEISEDEFLNIFRHIKNQKELISLAIEFRSIFSRDMFELLAKHLPKELYKKVDEILLFNSLSFTGKIIYKLKQLFTKKSKDNGTNTEAI